jgi:hypothetical protein
LDVDEQTDFRDFFLNVGREEAKAYRGGTFGLGRGVLFEISEAGSIVVFTRTTSAGRPTARMMAMGIGPSFPKRGRKFTGRHWWCVNPRGDWPEPLTGHNAERLAAHLGLDLIPKNSTGTSIMIVAPRIPESRSGDGTATLEEALDAMIDAARLYGWPLMVGRANRPEVRFEFAHAGKSWTPARPDAPDSPVRRFVEGYKLLQRRGPENGPTSWHQKDIEFGAGRAQPVTLGHLVFRYLPPTTNVSEDEDEPSIPKAAVALMREPRMVVKYMQVPEHPMGSTTVGIFVADSEFDHQFAESEPVAHDDWIPAKIISAKYERNPVKQALDKIRQAVKATATLPPIAGTSPEAEGIAPVIGDLLGGMVSDTPGFGGRPWRLPAAPTGGGTPGGGTPGGGTPSGGTPGGGAPGGGAPGGGAPGGGAPGGTLGGGAPGGGTPVRVGRATVLSPQLRVGADGKLQVAFPVRFARFSTDSSVLLRAEPRVVLDTGLEPEDEGPAGASLPVVLGWENLEGLELSDGTEVRLGPGSNEVLLLIDQPPDVAVTVSVNMRELANE